MASEKVAEAARDAFSREFREHPMFRAAVIGVQLNPKRDYYVVVFLSNSPTRPKEFPETIQNIPVDYKDGSAHVLF